MIDDKQKDMTLRILDRIPEDKMVLLLSNISERSDVEWVEQQPRLQGVLVGAAIIESEDRQAKIKELMGEHDSFSNFVADLIYEDRK